MDFRFQALILLFDFLDDDGAIRYQGRNGANGPTKSAKSHSQHLFLHRVQCLVDSTIQWTRASPVGLPGAQNDMSLSVTQVTATAVRWPFPEPTGDRRPAADSFIDIASHGGEASASSRSTRPTEGTQSFQMQNNVLSLRDEQTSG